MNPVIRSPLQIAQMFLARRKQFASRNQAYAKYLGYYFGKTKGGGATLNDVMAMDSRGKPLLRDLGVSLAMDRRYIANRMAPIVEDYQALTGPFPLVRVEAPKGDDDEVEAKAEKSTRYLYSTYGPRMSNMDWQQAYAAFCLSDMGDALYVPEIDPESGRVLVHAANPMTAYPSWWGNGPRKWELYDLLLAETWTRDEIERTFGGDAGSDNPQDLLVLNYMSPWQRTVVLASSIDSALRPTHVLADVEWKLGFCPAVWVRNKVNGALANSDIAPVLGLQDYYDFLLNVMADGVVEMTYPMRMVKNPIEREDGPMQYGPGATVEVGPDGDLKLLAATPAPQAAMMLLHQALDDINAGAGTSDIRSEGMPDRSNISGRALQTAQGPQATRVDLKRVILSAAICQLNHHVLAMQENAPLTPRSFEMFGAMKGAYFKEMFTPKEDIDGWYENTVRWDEMMGINPAQKQQLAVNAKQNQLVDDLTAMEMVGVQNPLEMREKIRRGVLFQAQLQSDANKMVQGGPEPGALALGPPGVNSPPGAGAPSAGPPSAAAGESAEPKLPPMIFQPPSTSPPHPALPKGVPSGVSIHAVEAAIRPIADQLKGAVYAVGDLATSGQAPRVTLCITDQSDYRAVKAAVTPLDPKPQIRYMAQANLPADKVRVDFAGSPAGAPAAPGGAPPPMVPGPPGAGPGGPPGLPPGLLAAAAGAARPQ